MTTKTTDNGFAALELDDNSGIATVTLQLPGRVNKIDEQFETTLGQVIAWAKAQSELKGLILASGHRDFCVGADITGIYAERDAARLQQRLRNLNGLYRALETLGVPVVAALTGSALGGGFELALACHHRVALDDARIQIGLPEVSLGLLPGAGGTQRLPRLIGLQAALQHIAEGKLLRAPKAKEVGFVDALAPDVTALMAAARQWILEHPGAKQPWDEKRFRYPGPQPGSSDARQLFMAGCALLRKKTAGAYRAPELAICAVQEGTALQFDRAIEVESRYFIELAIGDQSKDMIRTLWMHRQAAEKYEGLPKVEDGEIKKVAILGAGMMGAGLAFVSAKAGYDVVLKDVNAEALERGMVHCHSEIAKLGHLTAEQRTAISARIKGSLELADLDGTDLVIEAVFESLELKHRVTKETEPHLSTRGIWASNTSAIPITDLAKASKQPNKFIGLHFFSPVEKMQLVEIITTDATDTETLARSLHYARAIKKMPIVVGDGYGFYTTRIFSAYILEGAQMVAEGHEPVLVEWAARTSGMAMPPLQVFDEVTLTLGAKAMAQGRHYGKTPDIPGVALVEKMVNELDRTGRAAGRGFYEYVDGRRQGLWKGLRELASGTPEISDVQTLSRRLLTVQAVEAARCVADGVIKRPRDAEVGAVFGLGFAPNTGGPLSYIDRRGVAQFVADCDAFAERHGDRCAAPQLVRDMARQGERFFERV